MANFRFLEYINSGFAENNGINNFPGADENEGEQYTYDNIRVNLVNLHQNCISPLMDAFGDIGITSGYRSIELNSSINPPGVEKSQHNLGYAVDVISLSQPSSLIWNWCYQNLPNWYQLIWEFPEEGNFTGTGSNPSWVHISYVEGNNPKTTSLATNREDLHEMYKSEQTTRKGAYTHGIHLADENLI